MANNYLALTVGPIYYTIEQARKTRAVWAASYFFSWFVKRILQECKAADINVVLPYTGYLNVQSKFGSGKYADRIYFQKSNGNTKSKIENITKHVIEEVAVDIEKRISNCKKQDLISFLSQYINLHFAEDSEKPDFLSRINSLLDHRELTQHYVFKYDRNYLLEYLNKQVKAGSIIARDAFNVNSKNHRFRSIPEIATTDIERKIGKDAYEQIITEILNEDNEEEEFYDLLREKLTDKTLFKPFHKYYVVLYADGDNIGTLLQNVEQNTSELKNFSRQLLNFANVAEEAVNQYGGNTIYLGGEDILAFLPAACHNNKNPDATRTETLFSVIQQLDKIFFDTVGKYAEGLGVVAPTLSYGIMISYAKHPLKESMHIAHKLMECAKSRKEAGKKEPGKNTIGFRFQKHSGQYMQCFIVKSKNATWNHISTIIEKHTKHIHQEEAEVLSSVIHRLQNDLFFKVFAASAKKHRLEPFFQNFYNENVHAKGTMKDNFLKDVRTLAEQVFSDYPDNEDCKNILFSVLRFIHFINSSKED